MMNEQFRQLIMPGAETVKGTVVPAHSTITAILPAMIGDLHHRPQKNLAAKPGLGRCGGTGMEHLLGFAARVQPRRAVPTRFVRHRES